MFTPRVHAGKWQTYRIKIEKTTLFIFEHLIHAWKIHSRGFYSNNRWNAPVAGFKWKHFSSGYKNLFPMTIFFLLLLFTIWPTRTNLTLLWSRMNQRQLWSRMNQRQILILENGKGRLSLFTKLINGYIISNEFVHHERLTLGETHRGNMWQILLNPGIIKKEPVIMSNGS